MNILITICARGGSKGIPGKNIKSIGGSPLIYYSLVIAQQFQGVVENVDIVLSTDSEQIRNVVKSFNFNVFTDYIRPERLATDDAGKMEAIVDVKNFMEDKNDVEYDYLIDLDVTSPLRSLNDIKQAFDVLEKDKEALNIFSVSPANRNPYFNMVEQNETGYYTLCKKGEFLTRQSSPKVYDMNASFYIYRRTFFENDYRTAITNKSLIYNVSHICFDLDHPVDFEFMEFLITNNKLDFDFI